MKVQITIRGRTYTVRSDEQDIDLPTVARFVDARMAEVSDSAPPGLDDYTVAMLACLNIASEFERFRHRVADAIDGIEQEVTASAIVLRSLLPGDDGASAGTTSTDDPDAMDATEHDEAGEE